MARSLLLRKEHIEGVQYEYLGAYRLKVTAVDNTGTGVDPNVFLYLLRPPHPTSGEQVADFHAVASPADLAEYPAGEPRDGTAYPFFRLDYVELDFRAVGQADEVWTTIVYEVGALLKTLDRMETLVPAEEVEVGTPPDSGESSSGSDSTSA